MITLDATQLAVLAQTARGVCWLVDLEFASGTQYMTNFTSPITANAHTYTALGQILTVGNLNETGSVKTDRLKLRATIVDSALLALLIGPASEYRNRKARVYAQFLGDAWQPVGNPVLRWAGYMDKLTVTRTTSQQGKSGGHIEMSLVRSGLAKFRADIGLRLSHAQHQREYPGDLGFEYTESLVNNPVVWLSKEFQTE